jgi:hypothetical protein
LLTKTVEQLLDFTSTLKNSYTYVAQKGNQTFIFIVSKEMIVAIFIFLETIKIKPVIDCPSFLSYEVYQYCVSKSYTSGFLSAPSQIPYSILKLKGGSDEKVC